MVSRSEMAAQSPRLEGVIKDFCRQKGHGFVTTKDGGTDLFVHISEWVLQLCYTATETRIEVYLWTLLTTIVS